MPWRLEISTIDVGQGDSSLIIAYNTNGDPALVRSMLIDGGLAGYGGVVHDWVSSRLADVGGKHLDHIVVSHYDADHVGGVKSLLLSDNLAAIVHTISCAALKAWEANQASDGKRVAAAAAAAAAAAWGGYANGVDDCSGVAVGAGAAGAQLNLPATDLQQCAEQGANCGRSWAESAMTVNPKLIVTSKSCATAAIAAATGAFLSRAGAPEDRLLFTKQAVLDHIRGALPGSFQTNRLYRKAHIIDTGQSQGIPDNWEAFVHGAVPMWSNAIPVAPGVTRKRTSVTSQMLGQEILWHSGPKATPAPAGSPAIFLVTGLGYVWGSQQGLPPINSGQPQNDIALGLVVRFGNFFYFTAGDLPSEGEELAAKRLKAVGLPDPQNPRQPFAPATRYAAFKVGHHGSDGSTSQRYLDQIGARAAFVSCGINTFGKNSDKHPTQNVINRLHGVVPRFYLTNCKYLTDHVPASGGHNQLPDVNNRSRVCGDNADDNLRAGRRRGNAILYLSQEESTGTGARQRFRVRYWDNDDLPNAPGRLVGLVDETHDF